MPKVQIPLCGMDLMLSSEKEVTPGYPYPTGNIYNYVEREEMSTVCAV